MFKPNKPLNRRFNIAVSHIASRLFPTGFDVTESPMSPADMFTAYNESGGRLLVSSAYSDFTIFADVGINCEFRAWHDSKHILLNLGFDNSGEFAVYQAQLRDIAALYDGRDFINFGALLHADIVGQFEFNEKFGKFPENQALFVSEYLRNPGAAMLVDIYDVIRPPMEFAAA